MKPKLIFLPLDIVIKVPVMYLISALLACGQVSAQSDVQIMLPTDLYAYSPGEIYHSDSKSDPYTFPAEAEVEQFSTNEFQIVERVDQYTSQLNPAHPQAKTILDEWQQLRPIIIELLDKQQEVDELLNYMRNLAKVSLKHQDTVYLTSERQVEVDEVQQEQTACDSKDRDLLSSPLYTWSRCP
jgi:hypothetical protein